MITRELVRTLLNGWSIWKDGGDHMDYFRVHIKAFAPNGQGLTIVCYRQADGNFVKDATNHVHLYLKSSKCDRWNEDGQFSGCNKPPFNGGCAADILGVDALRELIRGVAAGEFPPNDKKIGMQE